MVRVAIDGVNAEVPVADGRVQGAKADAEKAAAVTVFHPADALKVLRPALPHLNGAELKAPLKGPQGARSAAPVGADEPGQ